MPAAFGAVEDDAVDALSETGTQRMPGGCSSVRHSLRFSCSLALLPCHGPLPHTSFFTLAASCQQLRPVTGTLSVCSCTRPAATIHAQRSPQDMYVCTYVLRRYVESGHWRIMQAKMRGLGTDCLPSAVLVRLHIRSVREEEKGKAGEGSIVCREMSVVPHGAGMNPVAFGMGCGA